MVGDFIFLEETLAWYISLFALPFLCALIATPLVARFAKKYHIMDRPGMHKTHSVAKPLLGGISIFVSFSVILYIFVPLDERILALSISTFILVITGLLDDTYNLNAYVKLSCQILAASTMVILTRWQFQFMIDYFEQFLIPGIIVIIFIIGWVVLMVNAFNLIDGLDGLAAGTAAIIFIAMAILSIIEGGRSTLLAIQLIGAGACLGFLVFNFNPARIFMGDTGSMLLGFIVASAHLHTIKFPFDAQLVLGSMFIMAYPALDVGYAIYRRLCNRCSIFKADKGHIHHVLLGLGFSVRKTVLIIYGANFFFALMAVLLLSLDIASPILLLIWIITLLGVGLLFKGLSTLALKNSLNTEQL